MTILSIECKRALLCLDTDRTPELIFALFKIAWFEAIAALNSVSEYVQHILLVTT